MSQRVNLRIALMLMLCCCIPATAPAALVLLTPADLTPNIPAQSDTVSFALVKAPAIDAAVSTETTHAATAAAAMQMPTRITHHTPQPEIISTPIQPAIVSTR